MTSNRIFLSHILDGDTPSYGNRNRFHIERHSSIAKGDIANDSHMSTTVHIGTHIDLPFHFFENGQTIEDFSADFWFFSHPAIIEIEPQSLIINHEIHEAIESLNISTETDILLIKTGIEKVRGQDQFWEKNPGFAPDLADYLRARLPRLRGLGFDSISVSSFTDRLTGREAHKRFLNPESPILLLEDMHLEKLSTNNTIEHIIVAPLRISQCDGLPCTVIATLKE